MKQQILELLSEIGNTGIFINDIQEKLEIPDDKLTELIDTINSLLKDYEIVMNKKQKYFLSKYFNIYKGILRINKKGFGFVDTNDLENDIYISKYNLNSAMDGDEVLVKFDEAKSEGNILRIIKHGMKELIGTVRRNSRFHYYVEPDSEKINERLTVTNLDEFNLVDGHKVRIAITKYEPLTGEIEQIIGHEKEPGVDVLSKLYEFNIFPEFNDAVERQLDTVPEEVSEEELVNREDWRNEWTCTIDGDDSKDFDDAISIKRLDTGYELAVHIADVSYYVEENTAIDMEAYSRGTSVYVVDRVIPMLPFQLSNGICSLNPNVDRLTLSCIMEFSFSGNLLDYRIVESVINSNERMTYSNVNKILDEDEVLLKEYEHCADKFFIMYELANKIRYDREERGAIDFDTTESKFKVDENGKVLDISKRERGEAERIIEDFMIAANECIATHMKNLDLPCLYRIHEQPEPKRVREFMAISRTLGYPFKGNANNVYIKEYQRLLANAKGTDEYSILSTFMLRSMSKARYDVNCVGHFGLGSEFYTHFTSPIRRYPDLIVHRSIRKYIFNHKLDPEVLANDLIKLEDIAIQTSNQERNAIDAERAVEDMKMAEFFEDKIGNEYEGIITSVTNFGMFVELPNTVEGLVHISNLWDDYYYFDKEHLSLIGELKHRTYRLGDHVRVKVQNASKRTSTIDFVVVNKKKKEQKKKIFDKPTKKTRQETFDNPKEKKEKFYARYEKKSRTNKTQFKTKRKKHS